MKKLLIAICLILPLMSFAQGRDIKIRQYMDTTNVVFQDIYKLWTNYENDLCSNEFIKTNIDTKKYWAESEIREYGDGYNLYQLVAFNYFQFKEFFIGINKRNDTLYEIQTAYYTDFNNKYELNLVITVPVIKTKDGYKLYNMFSLNKKKLKTKKINFVEFYYPQDYSFNKKQAKTTVRKINTFAREIGLKSIKPIKYYLNNTMTDIFQSFGITTALDDYCDAKNIITGGRFNLGSRMIYYTKGGENNSHEFIHILINDLRKKDTKFFDEGVCCYFGDHQSLSYSFHVLRLKNFLNNNPKVNLSQGLIDAYKIPDNQYTSDTNGQENNFKGWMVSDSTNYSYMIMATICDIAFRQGGYDKVKQMILDAEDNEAMYGVIEKHLGIKRQDVNKYIRDFLNKNY